MSHVTVLYCKRQLLADFVVCSHDMIQGKYVRSEDCRCSAGSAGRQADRQTGSLDTHLQFGFVCLVDSRLFQRDCVTVNAIELRPRNTIVRIESHPILASGTETTDSG